MWPRSGLLNPAIRRSREVFPAPEGPNKTVHGADRSQRTTSCNSPRRCSISISRKGSGTGSSPVDNQQRQEGKTQQEEGRVVGLRISKVLHLVVDRNGESAGHAGDA